MLRLPKYANVERRLRKLRICSKYLNYMRAHCFIGHEFERGCVVYGRLNSEGFTARPKSSDAYPVRFRRALGHSRIPDDLF